MQEQPRPQSSSSPSLSTRLYPQQPQFSFSPGSASLNEATWLWLWAEKGFHFLKGYKIVFEGCSELLEEMIISWVRCPICRALGLSPLYQHYRDTNLAGTWLVAPMPHSWSPLPGIWPEETPVVRTQTCFWSWQDNPAFLSCHRAQGQLQGKAQGDYVDVALFPTLEVQGLHWRHRGWLVSTDYLIHKKTSSFWNLWCSEESQGDREGC